MKSLPCSVLQRQAALLALVSPLHCCAAAAVTRGEKSESPRYNSDLEHINIVGTTSVRMMRKYMEVFLGTRGAVLHHSAEMVLCSRNHVFFPSPSSQSLNSG